MKIRCAWPVDDLLMIAYHDEEWGRRRKHRKLRLSTRLPLGKWSKNEISSHKLPLNK